MTFQSLYKEIFNQQTDNPALLKQVTEKYPYFSPAHFFLLQQTVRESGDYNRIAARTALHFANPYLLDQQLKDEEWPEISPAPLQPKGNTGEATVPQSSEPVINEPVMRKEEEKEAAPAEEKTKQNDSLLFEPLHTTDYFASQGIKLSEVVQPGDKMGRQLKSFTEWLKTMKKVHPDGLKEKPGADSPIDASVQVLAEKSNKEEEVLTESMAEVYIQQGKINKAKEIYEKLSLLNPSKNAYFAAKINEIQ